MHKILPIGSQVHKYDPKYPPNCPSCNHANEDMEHFWKCQSASRLQWRRSFLKELKQKLIALGTGPEVRDLLLLKIRAVLDGENANQVLDNPMLSTICEKQKEIHWDQLLRGRLPLNGTHTRALNLEHDKNHIRHGQQRSSTSFSLNGGNYGNHEIKTSTVKTWQLSTKPLQDK